MQNHTLKLSGLHCSSCAVDIDLSLEEQPGVKSSKTNYQKMETMVNFDPDKTDLKTIKSIITSLGYQTN